MKRYRLLTLVPKLLVPKLLVPKLSLGTRAGMLLLAALVNAGYVHADSIWQRRDPLLANLFADTRARNVGDLLTIVVQETTGVDDNDQRQMQKDTNTSGLFNFTGNTTGNVGTKNSQASVTGQAASSRSFNGSAKYTSDRNFTDKMTVVVVDVLPNGNLVVEGFRRRKVSGEERTLRVTGFVRPMDIGVQNTILSQYIGDFQITYLGKGPDSSFANQGWLGKFMNKLWGF